jgi:hypothetical protein
MSCQRAGAYKMKWVFTLDFSDPLPFQELQGSLKTKSDRGFDVYCWGFNFF